MRWTSTSSSCVHPTGLHGELAIEALDAGKHVIVEKPAETTVPKVDEIIKAQQKAGTRRHGHLPAPLRPRHRDDARRHPGGRAGPADLRHRVDRLVARAELLRLRGLAGHLGARRRRCPDEPGRAHRRPPPRRDGPAVEVFAYTGMLAHERIEVEDVAVGVVRFESGALGVLHGTTAAYPGLSRPRAGPRGPGLRGHRQRPAGLLPRDARAGRGSAGAELRGRRPSGRGRTPRGDGRQRPDRASGTRTGCSTSTSSRRSTEPSSSGSTWRPTGRPSP